MSGEYGIPEEKARNKRTPSVEILYLLYYAWLFEREIYEKTNRTQIARAI